MLGTLIPAAAAPQALAQLIQAEQAGIPAIWATSGGIGGADLLPTWAAAVKTERIVLGTAIVHTWPRHPIALAEEALAIEQLAPYARSVHFRGTWERAGFDPAAGYSDALLDELMVYGSETEVAAGLEQWIKEGTGEVLTHPLLDPADREGSLARAFAATARAARQVA